MRPGYHFQHLAGGHPQAGRQACAPLENVVVYRHAVQRHQSAHGRTGDDGVASVRQGSVVFVDIWLEFVDHPVQHDAALALDSSVLGILVGHRGILNQSAVALVIALHTHDNQLLAAFLHVVVHAPGLAEGGILVKEYVVTVEHVHHGVTPIRVFLVGLRQIDIRPAGGIPGELGNGDIPFDNHLVISSNYALGFYCMLNSIMGNEPIVNIWIRKK